MTTKLTAVAARTPHGALATVCVIAIAACSGTTTRATTAPPSTHANGTAPATTQPGAATLTTRLKSRAALVRQCQAMAVNDPVKASVCLAGHGVNVSTGQLSSCFSAANDQASTAACLARYLR